MGRESGGEPRDWDFILERVANSRDEIAYRQIFSYFAPRLKTFMLHKGLADALAEDVAQEVMLTVWRKAHLYDAKRGAASTWIFTIARNIRIDNIRAANNAKTIGLDEIDIDILPDASQTPEEQVHAATEERRVREALRELPVDHVRLVKLSFFENRAHGEIAAALDMPLGTVKSRIRQAMSLLRRRLEDLA